MPQSSAEFSIDNLRLLFGAGVGESVGNCAGVSTDSRSIRLGELFIALSGDLFDGHIFVEDAIAKGAAAAIVEYSRYSDFPDDIPLIQVENTLVALGDIAQFHRKRFDIPIIAIAGSAGKTSTKDLAASVLSLKYKVLSSEKNYNNRIGVPITLLQLNDSHSAAVIEIGTNEPGEIAELCRIARPTAGLITNIGKEHLEKLIDLDGVEREECALFDYLAASNELALVNLDDARLEKYSRALPRVLTFGETEKADVYCKTEYDEGLHPIITLNIDKTEAIAKLTTIGHSSALNAICASAIGASHGLTASEIALVLEKYLPPPPTGYGRMAIDRREDFTIINDCYNANPESALSALTALKEYPVKGSKIAVLGDMLELGASAAAEHDAILDFASTLADLVVAVGEEMRSAACRIGKINIVAANKANAAPIINPLLHSDSIVLVKGSRGMAMEDIISQLQPDCKII